MDSYKEHILLSFWLPFRKSNFINPIDDTSRDNLVNKFINFIFEYHLNVNSFDIHLTDTEYRNIFELHNTKPQLYRKIHIQKHITSKKDKEEGIEFLGDIKEKNKKIKYRDTIVKYIYNLTKNDENNSSKYQSFNIRLLESKVNNVNHINVKFKITYKTIKIFKNLNLFKDSKQITDSLLRGLEFNILVDEYGFYFIDIEVHKNIFYNINDQFKELFLKIFFSLKKDRFNILTYDQYNIIKDGLLFEYDNKVSKKDENLNSIENEKIENFFKKIFKVYHSKDFYNKESFDILPKKELNYILDTRNDNELKKRIYNIPFFDFEEESRKKDVVKKWVLNTEKYMPREKINFLYNLFMQDQIEKNAINIFLEVSTSISYIGRIINVIKEARDNLRYLITDTTESTDIYEDYTESNNEFTEEQLARYVEKIFSKIPNLKTIDTFLQEAYYIKVGNYSFLSYMEDSESINTQYHYIKWKNLLSNIYNTALSLETILNVYQNRQSLEELEELRQNELSTSDKNDVKNISYNSKQSIALDEGQKDFFIVLGLFIAFSDFYKDIWNNIYNNFYLYTEDNILSILFSIFSAFAILYLASKALPSIYKIIFNKKEVIEPHFLGINTIELRSKKKLDGKEIEHEEDHNFTTKINRTLEIIEGNINKSWLNIKKGKRRILFTRVNPRKRVIRIKYIFDKNRDKDFFELDILDLKKDLYNKNLKIKFFVVYIFVLKLKKDNSKDFFYIHNNSAKVYFNIGVVGKIKKKDKFETDEDEIRKKLYKVFLEKFNTENNQIPRPKGAGYEVDVVYHRDGTLDKLC